MTYQKTFKRYELKYILTKEQKEQLIDDIKDYMTLDEYGHTSIRNLYFDTPNYRLIRRSIEKPDYKEKIRIRSYQKASIESPVYVELKKKHDKVVYKRRVALPYAEATSWLCGAPCPLEGQIASEIDYFVNYYGGLQPSLFLSYEREAYYQEEEGDFRVTFDNNVMCTQENLTDALFKEIQGDRILGEDKVLMEIKCSGGIPIWMTKILSEKKLYKTSFSKYGIAYQRLIFPKLKGESINESADFSGVICK